MLTFIWHCVLYAGTIYGAVFVITGLIAVFENIPRTLVAGAVVLFGVVWLYIMGQLVHKEVVIYQEKQMELKCNCSKNSNSSERR